MNAQDRLREAIVQRENHLRAGIPHDRQAVILALLRARDRLPQPASAEPVSDLVTGHRLADPGGNKALRLCLESTGDAPEGVPATSGDGLGSWAERFLDECGRLTMADLVLAHAETGFMRIIDDGNGAFDAWITTRQVPAIWRERADFDWWRSWLARRYEPEVRTLQSERPQPENSESGDGAAYRRLADVRLKMMAYQLDYPADAVIDGCSVQTYRDVLGWLIGWALGDRDNAPHPQSERSLVAAIASDLAVDPDVIGQAVAAFTLDRESVAWHAAVPGIAAAPLVRVGPDRIVPSVHGLMSEPLLFLTRELRRRAAQEYHNVAYLREAVFRQDLYALFQDKRFVTSAGRIELRRDGGNLRTDIDAVVFDRKTGTIGLFELKSQDPFARSTAELARRRDNILYANRQVGGVLAWLKRHGADALLNRVDARTAKTFRAQKVYPYVLGRYLVHFNGGAEPDRRAAWGSWPQLLRLLDGQPFSPSEGNPLASLSTRLIPLAKEASIVHPAAGDAPCEIVTGGVRLTVHPSWAAFQATAAASRTH